MYLDILIYHISSQVFLSFIFQKQETMQGILRAVKPGIIPRHLLQQQPDAATSGGNT